MQIDASALDNDQPVAAARFDIVPLLLIPLLALIGLVFVRDMSSWVTLTIAGIGMGLIVFLTASGLTLVFGLMGVMNFAHGVFISLGAFIGGFMFWPTVMPLVSCWCKADSLGLNLLGVAVAAVIGMAGTVLVALIYERLVMRVCYGKSLTTQIMLTVSGMIVLEQLILATMGPGLRIAKPATLIGSLVVGDIAIEKYRLMTLVVGVILFFAMTILLKRSKWGLLIRASVEQREVVEAMGYRVKYLFVAVFAVGAALAALGGLFWGMFQGSAGVWMGAKLMTPIFIVLIIGGLGSVTGACVAAILVGLLTNYVGFVFPAWTAFSTLILLLLVGLWRPQGLYPANVGRSGM